MDVVGITKVRGCCTFLWIQDERAPRRVVFARAYHCAACIGEMVRSARLQRITVSGSIPMERVRNALARQRADLVDRWQRQLDAAAEAGFALDAGTARVLPDLLDAADRALERRFRTVPAGTPLLLAESRRAAMQCSLLGDFLFDAVLESCPEVNVAEQRVLSDALAHAAVEVLVRTALEREQARRRRETMRLAKLAHDLRNAATVARLSMDLLLRKASLPESKAARALDGALERLREGIEDSLLDEALGAGGLRLSRLRLGPVLAEAYSAVDELGARGKRLKVLLDETPAVLQVHADPRVMRPALRGLLRAAVQLARPGATIRVGATHRRDRARVAVSVERCLGPWGKRLPPLPALDFARRAARAHGGSLSARMQARTGCELRLELPRFHPD